MLGKTISHYSVLEKLGEGGMGVVYKAEDIRLERFVALKFLPEEYTHDATLRDRFLREARAASALNHPSICTIYEIGEDHGTIFIAMEFLDGWTLRELVQQGPMAYEQLLNIATKVISGLAAAHANGIIHRDIKLANIFVTRSGRAKILDFGLAKRTGPRQLVLAATGTDSKPFPDETQLTSGLGALGTAAYMSPEQALGKPLDERTDLFSFGIVLYEMATGQAPFRGDTTGTLFLSIVQENPPAPCELNPDVPPELQRIISRCLEKDRERRYQHALDIEADLQRLRQTSLARKLAGAGIPADAVAQGAELPWRKTDAGDFPRSLQAQSQPPSGVASGPRSQSRFWRAAGAGATALIMAAALAVFLHFHSHNAHALAAQRVIVLADFVNTTDVTVFDGTLRQAAAIDLTQSPYLNVVSDSRIAAALKQMEKPADTRLSREVAREVCLRTNSNAFLAGSIAQDGQQYRIELEAQNCETNAVIASAEAQASSRDAVIAAVGDAGRKLRRELGESLPSIQQHEKPLIEATTSSLDALQAFTEGETLRQQQGDQAALPYLKKAVELDPNFAQAHVVLGTIYSNLAEIGLANAAFTSAYELRNRVDQRERYYIESTYFESVTGEAAKARQIAADWVRGYPGDAMPRLRLARQYENLGQYDQAASQFREAIRLDPDSYAPYSGLMMAYMQLNKLDEAKAVYQEAKAHQIGSEYLSRARYYVAFLERDDRTMQALLDAGKGKPGYEDRLGVEAAVAAAYFGRLAQAEQMFAHVIDVANAMDAKESAAEHNAGLAFIEAEVGNAESARAYASKALAISRDRSVKERCSLVLARAGDEAEAEQLANELSSQYPVGTLMQDYTLPTVRALIEINQRNPSRAIELLAAALPYELAMSSFANVEPAYVRGLAYLQSGDGTKAAAEFHKLIANPGVVTSSITGALAYLQLARAERMSGNKEQARTAYQDFLALWKDADPNLPVLRQAKTEYAMLPN